MCHQSKRGAKRLQQKRAILAIDGLQPDVGHDVLQVVPETLPGQVLCARSLLSSARAGLAALPSDVVSASFSISFNKTTTFKTAIQHAVRERWQAG